MPQVQCKHCGSTAQGLSGAPLPGEAGELVYQGTCEPCWKDWLVEQVKLINELGLTPVDPEHYSLLLQRMKDYLRLSGEEG